VTRSLLHGLQEGHFVKRGHEHLRAQAQHELQREARAAHVEHGRGVDAHRVVGALGGGHGGELADVEVGVGEHHALGAAGGAAGVHHGGQVVAGAAGIWHGLGPGHQGLKVGHALGGAAVAKEQAQAQRLRKARQASGHGAEVLAKEQHLGVAVVQRVGHFLVAPADVHRVHHGTGPPGGVEIFHVAVGVQAHHGHAVAGAHALGLQHRGQAGHAVNQCGEVAAALAADEDGGLGLFLQAFVQGLGELHRLGPGVAGDPTAGRARTLWRMRRGRASSEPTT